MKRITLLVLCILVVGLFWLRNRRTEEIRKTGSQVIEKPLLPGLQVQAVQRLRIEHLERGVEVLLEKDPYGRWFLSEPIAYPAEGALVETILGYLQDAFGPVLTSPDLEDLSLAPPRIVVDLEERIEGRSPKTWRVELGAIDLDVRRVYARVPGHPDGGTSGALVTRVLRSLETSLDRNPNDYRSRACTTIPFTQVSEISRAGMGGDDLRFDVFLDGEVWRRRDEPRVSMDPAGIGFVLRALTSLRVRRFADDAPTDVSAFGLDDPRLQVELRTADGKRELIVLSTNPSQADLPVGEARWYVMRDGFPHVFEVRGNDVIILMTENPSLYDYAVVRAPQEAIQAVEFKRGKSAGLLLEQSDGGWWVEEYSPEAPPRRRRADTTRVDGLLAQIVQAELGEYAPMGTFQEGESLRSLVIRTQAGSQSVAWIGESWLHSPSGSRGPLFQRSGESIAAIAPKELMALFDLTLADLEDRLIHDVQEAQVDRIRVRSAGAEKVYTRDERHWSLEGFGPIDGAGAVILERLLHFEAERWLDDPTESLVDPIVFELSGRVDLGFTLARLSDQSLVLLTQDRLALLAKDPLQDDLHSVFVELLGDG